MGKAVIFPAGDSPAIGFAARFLEEAGISPDRVKATHILLNVPTKETDISAFGENVTLIGGNLDWLPENFPRMDLLKEERYVAENAALTADCAVRVLGGYLKAAFRDCPVLVIGFGRIGKCLAAMLKALDADVSVAARKPSDLGMLTALGYGAVALEKIDPSLYRAIINTAPAEVLAGGGEKVCVKIDLASRLGMAGENVLWARGLPGKMLPEESGACIARAVLRHLEGSK